MDYRRTVLDNGVRILTSCIPRVRSASVAVLLGVGSRYESLTESGISHFVEHVLFKGSTGYPTSLEISEAIEKTGGVLNGGTDKEFTVYWAKVIDTHLEAALDVLADVIRRPTFSAEETERERQVIVEEINMCLDSPQQRVNMLIDEVLWPEQPLGKDVAGDKETINSLDSEALRAYWASRYGAATTVISVAGNTEPGEAESLINKHFGDWSQSGSNPWYAAAETQEKPRILVERRDNEQAHLCLALRGISSQHPDRFIFDVINVILGEGMSCRLFRELRENKGLAYDIHSYVSHFIDTGSLIVYAGVNPANVSDTVECVLNELGRIRDEPVGEAELRKAKEMIKGRLVLRMEDSRSVSTWYGSQELLLGKIRTIEELIGIIEAITPTDLQRVAGDIFQSRGLNVAAIGPNLSEEELESKLKL